MPKPKKQTLEFQAVKYNYVDDEDGEAKISFRVDMQNKLSAFAVPAKRNLKIIVEVI
jgi:hypothetical protein